MLCRAGVLFSGLQCISSDGQNGGIAYHRKDKVSGEVRMGQAGTSMALCCEMPMCTAAYRVFKKVFKERTKVSGKRTIGATSFRQHSTQAPCHPPPHPPPFLV